MYDDHSLSARSCVKWFGRFEKKNFDIEAEESDLLVSDESEIPNQVRDDGLQFNNLTCSKERCINKLQLQTFTSKKIFLRSILLYLFCEHNKFRHVGDPAINARRVLKILYKKKHQVCARLKNG